MGILLALDDFGTGYSSLSYLKRLPIRRLKLDRAFVQELPHNTEDAAIATATLSMARELGMDVVAEGVETVEQKGFLAERGCQVMQGYLYSRPLPVDDFERWLLSRQE
jgi:EAL domain-containing protein (putative c-di-GMP-specific phosphodiesterase class I)